MRSVCSCLASISAILLESDKGVRMEELKVENEERYVFRNNRRLRTGHTTGTCAAAASKAATIMLLSQKSLESIEIITPNGVQLNLPVEDAIIALDHSSCAIRKDGGDDIDVTHGVLIYSTVMLSNEEGVRIDGGEGVGRVTRKGLDQPPGNAAINTVPRKMINESVLEACHSFGYMGGVSVTISVPDGEEIAEKTFNSRLGIVGGISIIGTSGIVEPMSDAALIDTIRTEMQMRLASGHDYILAVPGNYGEKYAREYPGLSKEYAIRCSNFIGETIDMAVELGVKGLLLFGDLGKLIKVAGGIMNTHSRNADCRMEILSANSILAGVDADTARRIMNCISTDEALDILASIDAKDKVISILLDRMEYYIDRRAAGRLELGIAVFSNRYGLLGITNGVRDIIPKINEAAGQ